jgi:hypothetical protein
MGEPELLTSFADFERIFGSLDMLDYEETDMQNYLAHAVRAFFEEGGRRLYVSRVYRASDGGQVPMPEETEASSVWNNAGYSTVDIADTVSPMTAGVRLRARYPGAAGDVEVTFTVRLGQNVLTSVPEDPTDPSGPTTAVLRGVREYDMLWITDVASPPDSPPAAGTLYWAEEVRDANNQKTWRFRAEDETDNRELNELSPGADEVRIVTLDVEVTTPGRYPRTQTWTGLTFHADHNNGLAKIFAPNILLNSRRARLTRPIVFFSEMDNAVAVATTLLAQTNESDTPVMETLDQPVDALQAGDRQFTVVLNNGSDGVRPAAADYRGEDGGDNGLKSGLIAFEDLEDISIVAAPGYAYDVLGSYRLDGNQVMRLLISHAERMRYRVAVLDAPNNAALSEVRAYRSQIDSTHAALYYPWITILDPLTGEEVNMPPSGYITGIYARNDVEHGVQKAPANEIVRSAIGLEFLLNKAQQDVLNPEGINCIRFFEGRGIRVWGARTSSSDPEWTYLNVRRYFAYLERSIELGTQWVVFESNGEALWANVRSTIDSFLYNEWNSGRLMGTKPDEAYFVRCDRTTMTQNDIDNGRLICLIGVAPLRPAEFVIFRIGQWTADSNR